MVPVSEIAEVKELSKQLDTAHENYAVIRSLFLEHARSDFIHQFIRRELQNIALNPDHIVRNNVGPVSFRLINSRNFDYTIRLSPPIIRHPHSVKWHGERQLMSVKGPGVASVRVLKVPADIDINHFQYNLQLKDAEAVRLARGSFLESASSFDILDISEINVPVIFEILTVRNHDVELYWTFDENLRSIFTESSLMTTSRLQLMFEIAHRMGKPVPESLYDIILAQGNAQLKLLAIQSLLLTDSPRGFHELQHAIDSERRTLSRGAQALFDALTPQSHHQFKGVFNDADRDKSTFN